MNAEIISLEEELRLAMLNNDVAKLDELIDDDLVFIGPDGSVATKQMDLDAHRSKVQTMSEITYSQQKVKTFVDLAVVTVKSSIKGSYANIDISGDYRYLRIWKNTNGAWKIISGSVMSLPN